jgi:hypothetical protein
VAVRRGQKEGWLVARAPLLMQIQGAFQRAERKVQLEGALVLGAAYLQVGTLQGEHLRQRQRGGRVGRREVFERALQNLLTSLRSGMCTDQLLKVIDPVGLLSVQTGSIIGRH